MKVYRTISMMLLMVNSIGALAGGAGFIMDPSGENQMPVEVLQYSPFENFLIPGIILFTVNGLFGLVVIGMIWFRYRRYPLFIMIQAVLLGGWITIQVLLLKQVNFLHIIFFSIAVVLLVMGYLLKDKRSNHFNYKVHDL